METEAETVTFLFTDVQNSSTLWERFPETMMQALTRHDALAEKFVAENDGKLLKKRCEGDSLFAVFSNPVNAVNAANALQQAYVAEIWSPQFALLVRMALHTGRANRREGDYYGPEINRCARIRSLAHGEQTLLSEATFHLTKTHLPEGVTTRKMGLHQLRGLRRPESVFQLLHPLLPAEFPPLGQPRTAFNTPGLVDWAFAQFGQGIVVMQAKRSPFVLEYNELLRWVAEGRIQAEDTVLSAILTNGKRQRAGDLRIFEAVRRGAIPTSDLPRRTSNGILAIGQLARDYLDLMEQSKGSERKELLRASDAPA